MDERIEKIVTILDKHKGEDIRVFDFRNSEYFVDIVIIVTGLGDRHLDALLNYLKKGLKPQETFLNVEVSDNWIVIDLGDILIHIMTSEYRELYNLEEILDEVANRC